MCFDARDEKFVHRDPDGRRFVRVCDIWGARALEVVDEVERSFKPAFRRCFEILRTYPVSIVEVRDKDLAAVCMIFQRINQGGKRLDRFDLISAMTFTADFDLRERFRKDLVDKLRQKSFGDISPAIVTQLMALLKKGACTEKAEFSLSAEEIQSVLLAADTLRKCIGVKIQSICLMRPSLRFSVIFSRVHRGGPSMSPNWPGFNGGFGGRPSVSTMVLVGRPKWQRIKSYLISFRTTGSALGTGGPCPQCSGKRARLTRLTRGARTAQQRHRPRPTGNPSPLLPCSPAPHHSCVPTHPGCAPP